MKKINRKKYISHKKRVCDWTYKQKFLFPFRVLKFRVKHGMVFTKVHDFISHKQSKRLEKPIPSNTRKQKEAKTILRKNSKN